MIHPHTELRFISEKIGYGVVATAFIPKGTITWALDKLDRTFSEHKVQKMETLYRDLLEKYTYRNKKGNHILCWDISRYINHSSDSNCITTAYEFEIAVRDILPGEELTDDYGYLNLAEPFECLPEVGSDRTIIYPDDLLKYYQLWDSKLLEAFKYFSRVNQPLLSVLKPSVRKKAEKIALGEEKMKSILSCYYNPK